MVVRREFAAFLGIAGGIHVVITTVRTGEEKDFWSGGVSKMTQLSSLSLGLSAAATLLLFTSVATAQSQSRDISTRLEEVVVTAQKREESKQDIAVSVSALDSKAIEKAFARDLQDIESMSPNLIIDPIFAVNTAAISIRGMQLNDGEKSFDPAVAVYLDGVYLATTTGAMLHMWDAESVEILRGPQGTLFGRNTIGGLVHVRRAKPTGEFGGKFAVTAGSDDLIDVKAAINFPSVFNDTLATKLSVIKKDGGGYHRNVVTGSDSDGDADFLSITAAATWAPNDSISFDFVYERVDDDTPSMPITSLAIPGDLFCGPIPTGCGEGPDNVSYHRQTRVALEQNAFLDTDAVTINGHFALNDAHSIEAVLGWRNSDEFARTKWDAVTPELFWTHRPQELEQASLELRWHAEFDEVQSVFGAYAWQSDYNLRQDVISPAFFGNTDFVQHPAFDQETETLAVFGQIDWDLSDALTLTVGGRYLEETKNACGAQSFSFLGTVVPDPPATAFGDASLGLCADPSFTLLTDFVDPATGATVDVQGETTWSKFTPRAGLTYRFDRGIAFVTYSEGFRSGGYNGRGTTPDTFGPYDPEEVQSIEAGIKTDWLDDRLRFNATVFFTDYENKQEDVVFPATGGTTVTLVQNAATATINGVEFELTAIPTDGLTLGANVGFLDAGFDEWTVPGLNGLPVDKSDFELRRAPDLTIGLNGLYERELANGDFLVFTANYNWRDDYYVNANTITTHNTVINRPVGLNEAYGLLDASINYETDWIRVSLYGKNLTDEDFFLHVLDVGTNFNGGPNGQPIPVSGLWTYGTINNGTTWGLEVQFDFGT